MIGMMICPEVATFGFLNWFLPGQNGRHFTDDIFRYILVNEKFHILLKISLKFVRNGPMDNNPSSV